MNNSLPEHTASPVQNVRTEESRRQFEMGSAYRAFAIGREMLREGGNLSDVRSMIREQRVEAMRAANGRSSEVEREFNRAQVEILNLQEKLRKTMG
jgi:hypothetical protein